MGLPLLQLRWSCPRLEQACRGFPGRVRFPPASFVYSFSSPTKNALNSLGADRALQILDGLPIFQQLFPSTLAMECDVNVNVASSACSMRSFLFPLLVHFLCFSRVTKVRRRCLVSIILHAVLLKCPANSMAVLPDRPSKLIHSRVFTPVLIAPAGAISHSG